jgi:imidazolonepropionase-like amidohydrolase
MKKILCLFACLAGCQTRQSDVAARVLAFRGANVLSMESETILTGQDVIVRDGLIEAMGSGLKIPEDAVVIDAGGKFLMPSLADMHVHVQNEEDLIVLAAQGISVVRHMHANNAEILGFKERARQPGSFLPQIYSAGPLFDGPFESHKGSISESKGWDPTQLVEEQKHQGYDMVKIYDALSPEGFREVIAAAARGGLPVVGHVPYRVGLRATLRAKPYTLEHLSGFAEAAELRSSPYRRDYKAGWADKQDYWNDAWRAGTGVRFAYVDESRFEELAKLTKEAGTWICPTLIQRDTFEVMARGLLFDDKNHWRFFPPYMLEGWQELVRTSPYQLPPAAELKKARAARRNLVKALHAQGVKLLLGTDIGNVGILPGFSVYQELANLREAGLSPYEALLTATRHASEALGRNGGVIAVGKKADLLLLPANPLVDASALEKREGLVLRGAWFPQAELERRMERLAQGYRSGTLRPQTYFGP